MARRHGGKTIDYKSWVDIPATQFAISGEATAIGNPRDFTAPATVLRVRSTITAYFDESVQVGDELNFTFGLGIVSTDAAALGLTAVPDPASDVEYPWLWWGTMCLQSVLAAGGERPWGMTAQILHVDTKAMRRVKPKESILWVIQSTGQVGSPVTNVQIHQSRMLIGT